jgi:hypothetical protein
MLNTLLSVVFTVLVLSFITSYVILRKAVSERSLRRLLLLLVVMTPPIALFAFAKALFFRPKPIRYSEELGRIEDEIESERARTFDGKIVHPSFSSRWRMSYLYAVEKSAAAASKLNPTINASLCSGISHLR